MYYRKSSPDVVLFFIVMVLLALGIVMVYSSSEVTSYFKTGDSFYYLKKQLLWAIIGLGAMGLMIRLDYWKLRGWVLPVLLASFALLVVVLIPGVGKEVNGAQRWINLGFTTFQPSEIIKLALVLFTAYGLSLQGDKVRFFGRGVLPYLLVLALACGLILAQPDLGTAAAAAGTIYIMLFAAGARGKHLTYLGLAGVGAIGVAIAMAPYRMKRFLAFLDPFADPQGSGFHIIQSLYALGSGGFFGVGLGESKQKFFYLPEQHTDFIYAIIGEELGFIGAALVILLFVLYVWRGFKIAITSPDPFASLLAVGLTSMIGLQALVNIGVVTGSMPVKGMPLPFISFGGTSLVFTLAGVGILLNISRYTSVK